MELKGGPCGYRGESSSQPYGLVEEMGMSQIITDIGEASWKEEALGVLGWDVWSALESEDCGGHQKCWDLGF